MEFGAETIAASLLGFFGAELAKAGGIGGGGIFVPLLLLVMKFSGPDAVPISKVMILAGAIPATIVNFRARHPNSKVNRPLLQIDIALLLVPATLGGTVLGVLLNVLLPEGVINLCLVLLLTYTAKKTLTKGWKTYKKEKEKKEQTKAAEQASCGIRATRSQKLWTKVKQTVFTADEYDDSLPDAAPKAVLQFLGLKPKGTELSTPDNSFVRAVKVAPAADDPEKQGSTSEQDAGGALAKVLQEESRISYSKILVIICLWALLFVISFIRGGKSKSPIGLDKCSGGFWALLFACPIIGGTASYMVGMYLTKLHVRRMEAGYTYVDGDLKIEDKGKIWKYIAWAMGAGVGAGSLGIGGGMVLGPLLLELGVDPQISSPVTHFMVFFTSSSTVLQFLVLGRLDVAYALYFGAFCFTASIVCMFGFKALLKKLGFGGSSIVLSLGTVIAVSAMLVLLNVILDSAAGKFEDKVTTLGDICGGTKD